MSEKSLRLDAIIHAYMAQFTPPKGTAGERPLLITSEDILREINDMADLTINEVAQAMLALGYSPVYENGRHGWKVVLA